LLRPPLAAPTIDDHLDVLTSFERLGQEVHEMGVGSGHDDRDPLMATIRALAPPVKAVTKEMTRDSMGVPTTFPRRPRGL